jgi:hypothetical protein
MAAGTKRDIRKPTKSPFNFKPRTEKVKSPNWAPRKPRRRAA